MIIEFIALVALTALILYKWSTSTFDFFEKHNIPFDKPVPLFGSQKEIVSRKSSIYDHVNRLYKQGNAKVLGIFEQRLPVYLIRDPALLKQITVKDFDHFVNHQTVFSDEDGDLFGSTLATMRNEKWKDMRSTLSPIYTGSKLRQMFTLINEVALESMEYLKRNPDSKTGIELDIKEYFTRFANDVIASTAFGLKINSFEDEQNEFYLMGKKVTNFSAWQNMKFLMSSNFKGLMKLLKIKVLDQSDIDYFQRLIIDAMSYRQEHKIIRPDMVNNLMEAKGIYINPEEHQKPVTTRKWTDDEIVAQAFVFFFAGFETVTVLMSFAAHELMENPDIQERLRREIIDVKNSLNGKPLTYEVLKGMKYMDMVISETLRRWPAGVISDRQCSKDFSYKDDEIELNIKAGQKIWIPIVGYHLDEQYFPNPLKFDPERFSEENKANIQQLPYMPFGVGPRSCIGNRFALMEAKAILFYLLNEFQIEDSPKVIRPIVIDPTSFTLKPKGGFWMKLVQR